MKPSRKIFVLFLMALTYSHISPAGTVVGGGPPSVQLESAELMALRQGALNGDIIRMTELGSPAVYLVPKMDSIQERRISANSIADGTEVTFTAETPVAELRAATAISLARTMKSLMPGVLPVLPEDLKVNAKPKVEVVPASEALN